MVYIVFLRVNEDPPHGTPAARWGKWLGKWTQFVTRSPLAHIAVIHGDVAVECCTTGTFAFHRGDWLKGNRWCLHGYFTIVEPWPVQHVLLQIASRGRRAETWFRYELRRLIHWLSQGYFSSWQCTGPPMAVSSHMGLNPPRRITTPAQLKRWLDGQGFDYREFASSDLAHPTRWLIGEDTRDDWGVDQVETRSTWRQAAPHVPFGTT